MRKLFKKMTNIFTQMKSGKKFVLQYFVHKREKVFTNFINIFSIIKTFLIRILKYNEKTVSIFLSKMLVWTLKRKHSVKCNIYLNFTFIKLFHEILSGKKKMGINRSKKLY